MATKIKIENQNPKLIWFNDSGNENGGYWYCSVCGAIYHQPQNWKPYSSYCMRCKNEWGDSK